MAPPRVTAPPSSKVNLLLPSWLTCALLVLLLGATTRSTLRRGVALRRQESAACAVLCGAGELQELPAGAPPADREVPRLSIEVSDAALGPATARPVSRALAAVQRRPHDCRPWSLGTCSGSRNST